MYSLSLAFEFVAFPTKGREWGSPDNKEEIKVGLIIVFATHIHGGRLDKWSLWKSAFIGATWVLSLKKHS